MVYRQEVQSQHAEATRKVVLCQDLDPTLLQSYTRANEVTILSLRERTPALPVLGFVGITV